VKKRVLQTGEAELNRLEERSLPTGGWDLVTRLPLRNKDGHVVGVIGIHRDVTNLKLAEQKVQDEVRRRDQFLAMLSHELRNPLSAIVTSTELLKADVTASPQRRRDVIGVLDRQSTQMARLLDDLLEASRVTQNKIELRRKIIDLRSAIRETADAVRPTMQSRGVTFTVDGEDASMYVDGDPARLEQILTNLLNNAMKYTPRGGHVELRARREGYHAVVSIRDDGAGIPRHMLQLVFELFVQSPRTLDRAEGGLGLGLTLVRALVAMHGGTVVAHSDGEGKGSTFVVRLPLVEAHEDALAPAPAQARSLPARGAKVAVVEDNADSRRILCELLELVGYECKSADNGIAGIALIDEVRPELAIIDLGLPGMDGLELARRLRRDPRHADVYLIALTGYGQPADHAAAREAGFDEHLVKPVRVEQLLTRLSVQASTRRDSRLH
jgi:two-component system CheB/CheR fusion protein